MRILLLCTLLTIFSTYGAAQGKYDLFNEAFNNNQSNWLVGDRARTNAQIVNGKFYLESKRAGYNYSRRTEEGYLRSGQDYEITIQIRQVKGTNTRGYGLEWGGNSLDNSFYEFWLRSDGFFSIDRFDDSSRSFHDYVPWTYSAAISTNDFNTLKVSKNGDQMTFSINGVQVHQMNAPPILGSEVGFIAPPLGAIEVEFLNIALLNNPPKPIFQKSTTPNIFVLLVGIADYQSDAIKDLSFTVSDVNNMERFYTNDNGGGVPSTNIIKLLDNQATKSNILKSLKSLCTRADNNDMVIFYYSGHGDVLGRESPKPLHLIPHDYSPEIAHSSINHQEIEALFAQCKADKKIWMMDACHSGGSLPQLKGRIKAHISSLEDKDVAILTSSDIGETSIEAGSIGDGRGLFSFYLTNALIHKSTECDVNNNGIVSILELYNYVSANVAKVANDKYYHQQHPQIGGKFNIQLPMAEVSAN